MNYKTFIDLVDDFVQKEGKFPSRLHVSFREAMEIQTFTLYHVNGGSIITPFGEIKLVLQRDSGHIHCS